MTSANFGLLIAYLIPGFVVLLGFSLHVPLIHQWLLSSPEKLPTLGGVLYATAGSVLAGMIVSTIRWASVDQIHALTGLRRPVLDYRELHLRLSAYDSVIGNSYRYYQHYANMFIAAPVSYAAFVVSQGWTGITSFVCLLLFLILYWFAARDTLSRYYSRIRMVLDDTDGATLYQPVQEPSKR